MNKVLTNDIRPWGFPTSTPTCTGVSGGKIDGIDQFGIKLNHP